MSLLSIIYFGGLVFSVVMIGGLVTGAVDVTVPALDNVTTSDLATLLQPYLPEDLNWTEDVNSTYTVENATLGDAPLCKITNSQTPNAVWYLPCNETGDYSVEIEKGIETVMPKDIQYNPNGGYIDITKPNITVINDDGSVEFRYYRPTDIPDCAYTAEKTVGYMGFIGGDKMFIGYINCEGKSYHYKHKVATSGNMIGEMYWVKEPGVFT